MLGNQNFSEAENAFFFCWSNSKGKKISWSTLLELVEVSSSEVVESSRKGLTLSTTITKSDGVMDVTTVVKKMRKVSAIQILAYDDARGFFVSFLHKSGATFSLKFMGSSVAEAIKLLS